MQGKPSTTTTKIVVRRSCFVVECAQNLTSEQVGEIAAWLHTMYGELPQIYTEENKLVITGGDRNAQCARLQQLQHYFKPEVPYTGVLEGVSAAVSSQNWWQTLRLYGAFDQETVEKIADKLPSLIKCEKISISRTLRGWKIVFSKPHFGQEWEKLLLECQIAV